MKKYEKPILIIHKMYEQDIIMTSLTTTNKPDASLIEDKDWVGLGND